MKYSPTTTETRQLREFVIFVSQLSFLKWNSPKMYLDVDPEDTRALEAVENFADPILQRREPNPGRELLALGSGGGLGVVPLIPIPSVDGDLTFSEGSSKRVTHLRYERSRKLREKRRSWIGCIVVKASRRGNWANLLTLLRVLCAGDNSNWF
jgi:hypothetical protein